MRLFYAVQFSGDVKDKLCSVQAQLRAEGVAGNYTARENMHLTLVFVGETDKVQDAEAALDGLGCAPLEIEVCGTGIFRRNGVIWGGIIDSDDLERLQRAVFENVRKAGFTLENRAYHPHITLVREARLPQGYRLPETRRSWMAVDRVSLMKSERVGGRLVYTEVKGAVLT